MIVVDTSAIIAICSNESNAWLCKAALEADDHILISAGTIAELLIVASSKSLLDQVEDS